MFAVEKKRKLLLLALIYESAVSVYNIDVLLKYSLFLLKTFLVNALTIIWYLDSGFQCKAHHYLGDFRQCYPSTYSSYFAFFDGYLKAFKSEL